MKSRVFAGLVAAALVLSACGDGGGKQDEVADMVIEEMASQDVEMDEDCVREAAGALSDDDAQKILDAGPEGDAGELSPEAQDAARSLINCVDTDALVDQIVESMVGSIGSENIDVDCLKEELRGLDLANLEEDDTSMMSALSECLNLDG